MIAETWLRACVVVRCWRGCRKACLSRPGCLREQLCDALVEEGACCIRKERKRPSLPHGKRNASLIRAETMSLNRMRKNHDALRRTCASQRGPSARPRPTSSIGVRTSNMTSELMNLLRQLFTELGTALIRRVVIRDKYPVPCRYDLTLHWACALASVSACLHSLARQPPVRPRTRSHNFHCVAGLKPVHHIPHSFKSHSSSPGKKPNTLAPRTDPPC